MILPNRLELLSVTCSLETNQSNTQECVIILLNQPDLGNAPNKIVLTGPWKNGRRYVGGGRGGKGREGGERILSVDIGSHKNSLLYVCMYNCLVEYCGVMH